MEEIKREEVKSVKITHRIFCDNCKSYIGESIEYIDGYYDDLCKINLSCNMFGVNFKFSKNLCHGCWKDMSEKAKDMMLNLGFVIA